MHNIARSLLFLAVASLVGCSTIQHSQTFRNRTMDYSQQNVQYLPTLQTPSNLATPNFAPALTVPPGPNDYPPAPAGSLKPPEFYNVVPIPALPPKPKTSNS